MSPGSSNDRLLHVWEKYREGRTPSVPDSFVPGPAPTVRCKQDLVRRIVIPLCSERCKAQSHSVGSGSHGWKMADPNLSPLTSHLLPCPLSTIFWAGSGQKKIRMKTQPKGRRGIRWLLARKGQLRRQQGAGVLLVTRDPNSIKKQLPRVVTPWP